jgi:NAD(P)-dependent dehydrogenase (short-subunit alcohol dehydrogenase family)
MTFAVNHMAYFVLTEGLRERLATTPGARVVSTASGAHQGAKLDLDDLQSAKSYSGFAVYGRSKLCNILWTREVARRFESVGVTANCLHPGFVATRFGDGSGGFMQAIMPLAKLMAISPQKGAETIVYLASSPAAAGVTGKYFYQCKPVEPSLAAQDDAVAAWLWTQSVRLAGEVV